ncbi:hypothetical protein CDAR_582701 [Caerostris darwini]|uniref:Uncharacterized protein n=1 Tax=Caerostris darwini TaxID=1538125 RepID=A0AAV4PLA8_9ARAC|nr:hypothetical protein CDAR_582701 [Caerostris darwini]
MKENPSMMGGYNNEKEKGGKSVFLRAFARKMKARKSRLNPHTQLFLLELLRYSPSSRRQHITRFHRICPSRRTHFRAERFSVFFPT